MLRHKSKIWRSNTLYRAKPILESILVGGDWMKITFLSRTTLGKWSVIMMISSWILFVVGSVLPWKPGYSGFEFVIHNPLQAIITIMIFAASVATSIMGLISVMKNKEHSILVFLAILSGLYNILGFFGVIANMFLD